jgi:hypothetical protein
MKSVGEERCQEPKRMKGKNQRSRYFHPSQTPYAHPIHHPQTEYPQNEHTRVQMMKKVSNACKAHKMFKEWMNFVFITARKSR